MKNTKAQEAAKITHHIKIILEIMNRTEDKEELQALDSAYWTMMNRLINL